MASVVFDAVSKRFGEVTALKELSLEVPDGEFLVLLGPSGCGKTTALRLLAGFEQVSEGHILIDGRPIEGVPAGKRDIAMVFQSYALYPHMSVYDNLAFGPRVRHEERANTDRAIGEVAEKLDLTPLLKRKPRELSGGQRQRVALGRALLRQPAVFLMDEPLSNLDAALRTEVRGELNRLHQELGITTVYVTHDQTEAMSLGDRVAVLSRGTLQQDGTPQDVYDDPVNTTVARFIGSPAMNLLSATLEYQDGWLANVLGVQVPLVGGRVLVGAKSGQSVLIGLRPDEISVTQPGSVGPSCLPARVAIVERMGAESWVTAVSNNVEVVCKAEARIRMSPGEAVSLYLSGRAARVFDALTGRSLTAVLGSPIAVEETPLGAKTGIGF